MRAAELLYVHGGLLLLLVSSILHVIATAAQVGTWSACTLEAASDGFPSPSAQCASAIVPLCAGGICIDPDGQTITLFLKRILATSSIPTNRTPARNVWVVPDRG
ncbi:hypothetical protein PybrP1_009564, partial [[Pythium] brassicae (nom. inval.)]